MTIEEGKHRSEPRTKTMVHFNLKKTEEPESEKEKAEQPVADRYSLPESKTSSIIETMQSSKLAKVEIPVKGNSEMPSKESQNSASLEPNSSELRNSTNKSQVDSAEKIEKSKQINVNGINLIEKREDFKDTAQVKETALLASEKHDLLIEKALETEKKIKSPETTEEFVLVEESEITTKKDSPIKSPERQSIEENNPQTKPNESENIQISEPDGRRTNKPHLSEKKITFQDISEDRNSSNNKISSIALNQTQDTFEKIAETTSPIQKGLTNSETDATAGTPSEKQKVIELNADNSSSGGSRQTKASMQSLQVKSDPQKETQGILAGLVGDSSEQSDELFLDHSLIPSNFLEKKVEFSKPPSEVSTNLDEGMVRFTEPTDRTFFLSDESFLKLNETKMMNMTRRSAMKLKTSLKNFAQKLDNKAPRFITFTDEQTKTQKKVELTQNLIRKVKSADNPSKFNALNTEKADFSLLKDQSFSNPLFDRIPFDPLDAFDEEEKEVFSSFRKERDVGKLPVTHNPLTGKYRIQITEKKLLFDMARSFYPEIDPIFHSLVHLDFGTPSCGIVKSECRFFFS